MHLRMSDGNYGRGWGQLSRLFQSSKGKPKKKKKLIHGKSKGLGKGGTRQFMICEVMLNLIHLSTLLPRFLEICVQLTHAILKPIVRHGT
jgi:hypothetical protein